MATSCSSSNSQQGIGVSECVVEMLGGRDEVIALGTIVDTAGLVLTTVAPAVTETSYSSSKLRCRLMSGRVVAADLIGLDPAYNLALLQVQVRGLKSVVWAHNQDLSVGTLLAAIGPGELPVAAGVVSVPRRQVAVAAFGSNRADTSRAA